MTHVGPVGHRERRDRAEDSNTIEPPPGGTLFRFFQIAPESARNYLPSDEKRKVAAEWFASMNPSHLQPDISRHPAMRRTNTTDNIILLSGHITLVLDKEERTLEPFDVLIQRGTNHAWVNRGAEDALLMGVMVDSGMSPR